MSHEGRPRELALGLSYKPFDGKKYSEVEEKAIVAEQRRNCAVMSRLDGKRSIRVWSPNRSIQTSEGGFLTDLLSGRRLDGRRRSEVYRFEHGTVFFGNPR